MAAPVSAAFVAIKINDVEQRVKEGREALLKSLENEKDKRSHLHSGFDDEFHLVEEY